jgi:hypothetical protein
VDGWLPNHDIIPRMRKRNFRRLGALVILVSSLVMLVWGLWPVGDQSKELALSPAEMQLPTDSPFAGGEDESVLGVSPEHSTPLQPLGVPEPRRLTLEWRTILRSGDTDFIHLRVSEDIAGKITPTTGEKGNQIIGEPVLISNVYTTHNVMADARLEIAGLTVSPNNQISQVLRPGEDITFTWSVRSSGVGRFPGTVWLYLRFLPLDGGQERQLVLTAQVIEIQVVNLFGISAANSRLMGILGVSTSGLLGGEDILKGIGWLFRRLRTGG